MISDLKLDDGSGSFLPDEKQYTNFYPYGMPHPNRSWEVQGDNYRYGFNGVEKEQDVYGKGNLSAMDFRMYDSRVGRWWGVDKIVKVDESPYAAFFSNPINYADPSGLDGDEDQAVMPTRSNGHPGDNTETITPVKPKDALLDIKLPESAKEVLYYGPGEVVDMAGADRYATSWNANGWARDKDYFWKNWKDTPAGQKALSQRNLDLIQSKDAPTVDLQWKKAMPKHANAIMGESIEHHHIEGGRWATPVPQSLHRGKYYKKLLHPTEIKKGSIHQKKGTYKQKLRKSGNKMIKGASKTLQGFSLMQEFMDFFKTKNPHSIYNLSFGVGKNSNQIYYLSSDDIDALYGAGKGLYFQFNAETHEMQFFEDAEEVEFNTWRGINPIEDQGTWYWNPEKKEMSIGT